MWPDDETPEPAAWINFNAATGERNVSFICESELASIPLWPEPPPVREPLSAHQIHEAIKDFKESERLMGVNHIHVARAIERAHGITKGDKP